MATILAAAPAHFDSLRTLSVWTNMGDMMVSLHEVLHGGRCPYVHSKIFTSWGEDLPRSHTVEKILESLGGIGGENPKVLNVRVSDGRENTYVLSGSVALASSIPQRPNQWVLVIDGELKKFSGDHCFTTPTKVVCYYDVGDGCGFCLLPEKAARQIWARGYYN